jgi:hypothetical protein
MSAAHKTHVCGAAEGGQTEPDAHAHVGGAVGTALEHGLVLAQGLAVVALLLQHARHACDYGHTFKHVPMWAMISYALRWRAMRK